MTANVMIDENGNECGNTLERCLELLSVGGDDDQ